MMKIESFKQSVHKFDSLGGISELVERRRIQAHRHDIWNNNDDRSRNARFGRKSNLESPLARVIVHAARKHQRKRLLDGARLVHFVASDGTDSSVCERGRHDAVRIAFRLNRAKLEVELENLFEIGSLRKAIVLVHVMAKREISLQGFLKMRSKKIFKRKIEFLKFFIIYFLFSMISANSGA